MRKTTAILAILFLNLAPVLANAASTLETVRARGSLRCGTQIDMPGAGAPDSKGVLQGIDIEYCRAIAAAVFGDVGKVVFVSTTPATRFAVLQSGDIDVLIRETTNIFTRDTQLGVIFANHTMYDAQGALVPAKLNAKSLAELDGASICVNPGSNSALNIGDYYQERKMKYTPVQVDNQDSLRRTFFEGRCDVFTGDRLMLYANRAVAPKPDDYVVLPDSLAKSPLGPVVRQGDDQWLNIVKWVVNATILAEEKKLTRANVDQNKDSKDPEVRRLLGGTPGMSKQLGLNDDWAYQIIKQLGNYAEIYDRTLGDGSALKFPRGLNKLWNEGGLLYSPPFL